MRVMTHSTRTDMTARHPGDVLALLSCGDAALTATLAARIDLQAFASYLAFQEIIDGDEQPSAPGGHAFLCVDSTTGSLAVIDWELDVAVGTRSGLGDAAAARTLAARLLEQEVFAAMVDAELERLAAALVAAGADDAPRADRARALLPHTRGLHRAELPSSMRAPLHVAS